MNPSFTHNPKQSRRAFTLIELIVVMGIIMVLGALAVALMPNVTRGQKAGMGADQLQGWLLIAKMRALRDQVPTGLRLNYNASSQISDMQFIQQPEDYHGGPGSTAEVPVPNGTTVFFSNASLVGFVDAGDYLEINGGGLVKQIAGVQQSSLDVVSPVRPYPVPPTKEYRIIRKPRLLVGESPVRLPQDVTIDGLNSLPQLAGSPGFPTDILFAPSGEVISGVPANTDRLILWVRDSSLASHLDGEPVLIVIQVRTGFIGAHPVDTRGTDPYSFAKDGRSSGI